MRLPPPKLLLPPVSEACAAVRAFQKKITVFFETIKVCVSEEDEEDADVTVEKSFRSNSKNWFLTVEMRRSTWNIKRKPREGELRRELLDEDSFSYLSKPASRIKV